MLEQLRWRCNGPALLIVALALILVNVWPWLPVQAQQDPLSAEITSPKSDDQLFGAVPIIGTATNPKFQRYKIEFAAQDRPTPEWFLLTEITQQVQNGPLALWDTTTIPDGVYQLRLRVVLQDGNLLQYAVTNLQVRNQQPSPLPTLPPTATEQPFTPTPTEGPSATPLIQQPPTSTSAPTIVMFTPMPTIASDTAQVSLGQFVVAFQQSFCNGVYLAVGAFVLIGGLSFFGGKLKAQMQRVTNRPEYDAEGES